MLKRGDRTLIVIEIFTNFDQCCCSAVCCRLGYRYLFYLFRYLKYILMPEEIRKQDAISTVVHISINPIGSSLAWDFVRANWNVILNG